MSNYIPDSVSPFALMTTTLASAAWWEDWICFPVAFTILVSCCEIAAQIAPVVREYGKLISRAKTLCSLNAALFTIILKRSCSCDSLIFFVSSTRPHFDPCLNHYHSRGNHAERKYLTCSIGHNSTVSHLSRQGRTRPSVLFRRSSPWTSISNHKGLVVSWCISASAFSNSSLQHKSPFTESKAKTGSQRSHSWQGWQGSPGFFHSLEKYITVEQGNWLHYCLFTVCWPHK